MQKWSMGFFLVRLFPTISCINSISRQFVGHNYTALQNCMQHSIRDLNDWKSSLHYYLQSANAHQIANSAKLWAVNCVECSSITMYALEIIIRKQLFASPINFPLFRSFNRWLLMKTRWGFIDCQMRDRNWNNKYYSVADPNGPMIGIYQISVVKWPIIWIFTNGKFKFTTCHVISKFSFYVQKFIFYLYLALLYIVYIVCMINWTKRYTKICAFCVVYVLFAFLMVLFLEIVMAMLHSYTK